MDLEDLAREIRELRERLDDWPTVPRGEEGLFPAAKIEKDPFKPNYKLKPKKLPIYRGDKSTYGAWRRAVLSTLKADWNTFQYDDPTVFLMIYNALEGKAQKDAASFFESGGPNGRQNPEDFIGFLDRSNWDVNKVNRARSELNALKMGARQRWSSFFSQWSNKLTESRGDQWPDDVKISLLKGTLNHTLRAALANNHLLPSNNYFEWIRIVGQIAQQHDELVEKSNAHVNFETRCNHHDLSQRVEGSRYGTVAGGFREPGRSGTERGYIGEFDSSGDVFMGGINSTNILRGPNGSPLRAKWKSPEKIRELKSEGRCYRCERKGCNTRICRLLPAVKPKFKGPVVNNNDMIELDPDLYEEVNEIETARKESGN